VLNLAGNYASWIAVCESLLDGLDESDRRAIFGLNARRFYRID
jgi:L-fuconolactonase